MNSKEIRSFDDLKEYVFHPKKGKVCHYTSFESLIMILKNRSLRFSRFDLMNDYAEKELSKCLKGDLRYIISFAKLKESVAMWALYGKYSSLRLRIEFPIDVLLTSIDNNFFLDSEKKDKIPIYGTAPVNADYTKKGYTYSTVVYFDKKKQTFRIDEHPLKSITAKEEMIQSLAGTIKYDSWEYEKESRVAVVLHRNQIDQKDIKYIYAGLNDTFISKLTIRYSPWIPEEVQIELSKIICNLAGVKLNFQKSELYGEVSLM